MTTSRQGLLWLILVGCGGSAPESGISFHVGAVEWVGADEAAPQIARLGDWTLSTDGTLYLADSRASVVYVRRGVGQWDSIGRPGEGPGEFVAIAGLAIDATGRLWVSDSRFRSLTVFKSDGQLDTIVSWAHEGVDPPRQGRFDDRGRLAGLLFQQTGRNTFRRSIVRAEGNAWRPDIQALPDVQAELFEIRRSNGRLGMVAEVPFTQRMVWALAPNGDVWVANTSAYRIIRLNAFGDSLASLSRTTGSVPVTEAVRAAALTEAVGDGWATYPDVDPTRVPANLPPILRLIGATDGRLLVERPRTGTLGSRFDIYSASGTFEGTADVPVRFAERLRMIVTDAALMGVVEDTDGIPRIARVPFSRNGR